MNTMRGIGAVGTAGSVSNLLTGQIYERAPYPAMVRFSLSGDAAGAARCAIFIGGRAVMQESPISRVAVPPIIPDQVVATAPARAGEQITIAARDTGVVGVSVFWQVDLKPLRR